MKYLEDRILKDGIVGAGDVLKVDSFLNHQMDVDVLEAMGDEFFRLYKDCGVNKILTIEASGIGIAAFAARAFHCPMVFAKKSKTSNIAADVYSTSVKSYTHGNVSTVVVSKQLLLPSDKILIIDDFLANGEALDGLLDLCRQAGAEVVGAGIAVEKAYQPGGERIRSKGVRVESLARIKSMSVEEGISFC